MRWSHVAVALGVALMVPAAFASALQIDEANVLRHITRFGSGHFTSPGRPGLLWALLTPLLRLEDPATIVLGARCVCMAASAATFLLVRRLAERAGGEALAIAAVLLLATSMTWQGRAFELRTDTFTTPLLLGAALLLWRPRWSWRSAVGAGVLVGVAGLLSQKAIYGAAGLGLAWALGVWLGHVPKRWGLALAAAVAAGAVVGLWYAGMAMLTDADVVTANVRRAANTAFAEKPLRQKLLSLGFAGNRAPLFYLALLPGAVEVWRRRRESAELLGAAVVGAFLVSTILWHRGYYLYFVAHFEPWLCLVAGAGVLAVIRALAPRRLGRAGLVAGGLAAAVPAAFFYSAILQASIHPQLQVLRDVRSAFPEPVPYWDGAGLVPGYPEVTLFNTGANRGRHRKRFGPNFLIPFARDRHAHFFVRNYLSRDQVMTQKERLWHWKHFVPWRPNVYLRGGRIHAGAGGWSEDRVRVGPAGAYTVWFFNDWRGQAEVDGRAVKHGQVLELAEGVVTLRARSVRGSGQLWLMLGADRTPYANRTGDLVDRSLYVEIGRRGFIDHVKNDGRSELYGPPPRKLGDAITQTELDRRRGLHRRFHRERDARLGAPRPPKK